MKFRDIISEKQNDDYVLQALADKDINAKIEGNMVLVDREDVQTAQKVLKSIGCTKKVKGSLNEEVQNSLQTIVDALINAGNVTQTAHWNLRSSAFVAIHPWFGETYDALFDIADAVAEQIKIANIDLIVNVNRGSTAVATDEYELFMMVQTALDRVKMTLDMAAADSSLSRPLQNLIDGWTADITKMIWFIQASTK
jgi:DNA-binding ferritin-like protein